MNSRVFNIMQYERIPLSNGLLGDVLLDEPAIIAGLEHKTIKEWAYILHDKDVVVYDESSRRRGLSHIWFDGFAGMEQYASEEQFIEETIKAEKAAIANSYKPRHWHLVLRTDRAMPIETIAKWFGIEPQYIEVPKGRGAFLDCVAYLTHEGEKQQAEGKYLYPDSEVKANFDFRERLDNRDLRNSKYDRELTDKQWYRNEVLSGNLRPKDMMRDKKLITYYTDDAEALDKMRRKYLAEIAPMPDTRLNYYVCGAHGGIGKGLASYALARSLYPDIEDDDDLFFTVGGEKTSFDDYDGQPIIIWNDIRPIALLKIFGDRGQLFDSLDMHPKRKREHIKYGKIVLTNEVNIFNSVIPYSEFLDGLAGEYKDRDGNCVRSEMSAKEQAYRRFPIIIPVSENDFEILLNKGVLGQGTYTEYFHHKRIVANLKALHTELKKREDVLRMLDIQTMKPVVEAHNQIVAHENPSDKYDGLSNDEIMRMFSDYGCEIDYETLAADMAAEEAERRWLEYVQNREEEETREILEALERTKCLLLKDYETNEPQSNSFADYVRSCEENGSVCKGFVTLCHEYGVALFSAKDVKPMVIKYDGSDRQHYCK